LIFNQLKEPDKKIQEKNYKMLYFNFGMLTLYRWFLLLYPMRIDLESVDLLESKLTALVERYTFLKEENEFLISKVNKLETLTTQYKERLDQEQESYRLLKIAKTIKGSRTDSRDTKNKISTLIREIDKCIAKLNQ